MQIDNLTPEQEQELREQLRCIAIVTDTDINTVYSAFETLKNALVDAIQDTFKDLSDPPFDRLKELSQEPKPKWKQLIAMKKEHKEDEKLPKRFREGWSKNARR